ncbi:hypothetical protein MPER_09215 [Moniliophthora perniciosa FA553]|nr:hypothetical protein MPER_09215 [Moniliophthora perniciosa FA553]
MNHQSPSQLRISERSFLRRRHRYHPYPRPVYPDPDEQDTAYEPHVDNLSDIIRDVGHRARVPLVMAIGVEEGEERQRVEQQVEEGNNRLILCGILLLEFLFTYFLFVKHPFLLGFLFRGGGADDYE